MRQRGKLTDEIKKKSKDLIGYEISQKELRLLAYIDYIMKNEQYINIAKIDGEERDILQKWKELGYMEGGASGLSITKEFYDVMQEILWLGYIIGGAKDYNELDNTHYKLN